MFISIYPLLKREGLSVGTKLIRYIPTYACPAWEFEADSYLWKLERLKNKFFVPLNDWYFAKAHTIQRFAHGVQNSVLIKECTYVYAANTNKDCNLLQGTEDGLP
jgi:hypothetical protein